MNRIITLILISSIGSPIWAYQELRLPFYGETVRISYEKPLSDIPSPRIEERALQQFYLRMKEQPPSTLLHSLQKTRRALRLNDWLYYELIQKTLQEVDLKDDNLSVLWSWVLLSQLGFDTQLAYLEDKVFLYVYTLDQIYEAPVIENNGRNYVNLTDINRGRRAQHALYLLNFQPTSNGHAFSFHLRELPLLRPEIEERQLEFRYKEEVYTLSVAVDRKIARYMSSYPILAESYYLETPLSDTLAKTLYPYLADKIAGKNEWQSAEFLAAFTRSAFLYKEDKVHFGCSKPMVAEEVFLYPYSDCEDRTALFFKLVRELLDLPMLLIAYPDHLTLAVALPPTKGNYIRYANRNYYICDPTGPVDSHEVGLVPKGYENEAFRILKSFE